LEWLGILINVLQLEITEDALVLQISFVEVSKGDVTRGAIRTFAYTSFVIVLSSLTPIILCHFGWNTIKTYI
jgi:hypothetical protein